MKIIDNLELLDYIDRLKMSESNTISEPCSFRFCNLIEEEGLDSGYWSSCIKVEDFKTPYDEEIRLLYKYDISTDNIIIRLNSDWVRG